MTLSLTQYCAVHHRNTKRKSRSSAIKIILAIMSQARISFTIVLAFSARATQHTRESHRNARTTLPLHQLGTSICTVEHSAAAHTFEQSPSNSFRVSVILPALTISAFKAAYGSAGSASLALCRLSSFVTRMRGLPPSEMSRPRSAISPTGVDWASL